jgi:hypothetical protein
VWAVTLLLDKELLVQGWSVFSHVQRTSGAMVVRDPIDLSIKGIRYQITRDDKDNQGINHFSFEDWCYKARGSIIHRNIFSFNLHDRCSAQGRLEDHVSQIKVMSKLQLIDSDKVFSVLKCAARIIENIDRNQHFDAFHVMQKYGLSDEDLVVSPCGCPHMNDKRLRFF